VRFEREGSEVLPEGERRVERDLRRPIEILEMGRQRGILDGVLLGPDLVAEQVERKGALGFTRLRRQC